MWNKIVLKAHKAGLNEITVLTHFDAMHGVCVPLPVKHIYIHEDTASHFQFSSNFYLTFLVSSEAEK